MDEVDLTVMENFDCFRTRDKINGRKIYEKVNYKNYLKSTLGLSHPSYSKCDNSKLMKMCKTPRKTGIEVMKEDTIVIVYIR